MIDLALRMIRRTQMETRHSIQDLRDNVLQQHDLAGALYQVVQRFEAEQNATIEATIHPLVRPLSVPAEQNILRIAREALHNAIHHARANTIRILFIANNDEVELRVEDDGEGFDPARSTPGHFGLVGMRERAANIGGQLNILSSPGTGCIVRLTIPYPKESS